MLVIQQFMRNDALSLPGVTLTSICPALPYPCPALALPCLALPCPALPCPALPCPALTFACPMWGRYQKCGQPVLIGGSMGTSSYVLVGTQGAMEQTFGSTCHGAGRAMSRAQSKKTLGYKEV